MGLLRDCFAHAAHTGKTQLFNRAEDSTDTADVLGAGLGPTSRQLTSKEVKRQERSAEIAFSIGLLPTSLRFKAGLAASVFSTRASWVCLFGGRRPSSSELAGFSDTFRSTVKGSAARGDRSSRDLQRLFLLGHTSDLALVASLRLLKAAARWARYKMSVGQGPSVRDLLVSRPFKALAPCHLTGKSSLIVASAPTGLTPGTS